MHPSDTRLLVSLGLGLSLALSGPVLAHPGPGEGPDENLEAIEPSAEPISIGLAGEYPADIARYLLVQGVSGAQLSPAGDYVAVS